MRIEFLKILYIQLKLHKISNQQICHKKTKRFTKTNKKTNLQDEVCDPIANVTDEESVNSFIEKKENKAHIKPVKRKMKKTPEERNGKCNHNKLTPPTLEEINELNETRNLFHSNLFRLQVKEMLAELEIKNKYLKCIDTFLEKFKVFLKNLPTSSDGKEDMDSMLWIKESSLKVPLDLTLLKVTKQKVFQFQYIQPIKDPFLIGAAAVQSLLGPQIQADICVIMPPQCFQKENWLNIQYDQKRAYYLTYIAQHLLKSEEFPNINEENLKFNYYNNNPLKPVLEIIGGLKLNSNPIIRIFIVGDETSFKLNRFVPWNNNIRLSLFDEEPNDDAIEFATPNYNANVLFDITMERNQQLLREVYGNNKNFQDGLILLKVWLRQRQLDKGFNGFNSHLLTMFIAYLFKQRKLHLNMSSYQVARNVWNQLAFSSWHEFNKGLTLCPSVNIDANQPTLEQMHTYYPIVFIDVTGYHNLCYNLTLDMYEHVRFEAKLAVQMLNDMNLNSFRLLFMNKYPLYSQCDHILKINKTDTVEQILDMHVTPADKCNFAGHTYSQLLKVVTSLLKKGLDKRVEYLIPLQYDIPSWSVLEQPDASCEYLHLGLILNGEQSLEILDKGPESIEEKASEFRKFWGEKAQLRRFQDGSITEAVVWALAKDDINKKRLVVRSIVLHLLHHHLQLEEKDVEYIAGEYDIVYKINKAYKMDSIAEKYQIQQDTDAEALSLKVIREFDNLVRKLINLKELPLEIVSIAGISPVLRYCEPQPVLPTARNIQQQFHASQIQQGIIQLGLSGKWPGELTALRAIKTAFYLQIGKLLHEHYQLPTKVTYNGIMVLQRGYCFNFEIAHPKEVSLLKREKTEKGITKYVDCTASIALEKRHYILPKVAGALKALYQKHNSFGPAVMISKRWLYSQLIDDGLWPDECTELLIASQYQKMVNSLITNAPQMGFIRFLQLLATIDWKTEMILVNFNDNIEGKITVTNIFYICNKSIPLSFDLASKISDLEQRFNTERDNFPPLCIVTGYDQPHYGNIWSSAEKPNHFVLARVKLLAKQSLDNLEMSLTSTAHFIKPSKLFMPSNEGYHLIIQIKPDNVTNTFAHEFGSAFVEYFKPNWRLPLAGTNFLKTAVEQLREAYSDFAAFFYNPCGGKEIAVIWKPNIFETKEFKITDVQACSLTMDNKRVQVNKETLIEDFKFILKDFYLRIGSVESVREASRTGTSFVKPATKRYFDYKVMDAMAQEKAISTKVFAKKKKVLKENFSKKVFKKEKKK
uniref:Nucleolar protein 6 n=1 Tax=Glossina brevipalpis TaxID=37001 RepID=A0A1A9W458_9MUSC